MDTRGESRSSRSRLSLMGREIGKASGKECDKITDRRRRKHLAFCKGRRGSKIPTNNGAAKKNIERRLKNANMKDFYMYLIIFIAYCLIGFIFEIIKTIATTKMQQKALKQKTDQIYLSLIEYAQNLKERLKK